MANIESSGTNLKQEGCHKEEIIPAHQHDLDVSPSLAELLQVTGGVDAAKAAPENQDAFLRC
jgi:hypothetical protein